MKRNKLFIFLIIINLFLSLTLLGAEKREYQLSNQMIINGNFEGGNTDFYTDYQYSPTNMRLEGTYCLSQNPKKQYSRFDSCMDKTNQSGFMLLMNSFDVPDKIVWKQTVRGVELNSVYLFSFWCAPVFPANPPFFDVYINGTLMQPNPVYISEDVCKWNEVRYIWNSYDIDTAEIIIYNRNLRKSGNDFVLDDISFSIYCSLIASAQKSVSVCKGQEARLNVSFSGGEPPINYEWFPKTGLDNPYSLNPTVKIDQSSIYIVRVTDSKSCEAYDTVKVNIFQTPQAIITSDKGFLICPCDSAKLTAPSGMSYLWSTGETTQSIYTNKTGSISLSVVDNNGCSADTTIFVEVLDVTSSIQLGKMEVEIGETFNLPVNLKSSDTRLLCGFNNFSLGIRYDKSLLQPLGIFSNRRFEGDYEIIELIGNNFDQLLNNLKFTAVLGKVECSPIEITNFNYDCNLIKITTADGEVCLSNLCKEGGTRLINTDARLFFNVISVIPYINVMNIQFGVVENTHVRISVYDNLGRNVHTYDLGSYSPGTYNKSLDISFLSAGAYYLMFSTPTSVFRKSISITR